MNTLHDPASLSITTDNRHQFLETAIAEASDADREIRQAELRGMQRRHREEALKLVMQRAALGVLGALAAAVVLVLLVR